MANTVLNVAALEPILPVPVVPPLIIAVTPFNELTVNEPVAARVVKLPDAGVALPIGVF